ncbi:MAG: cell division protein ZapA [Halofilum sp. (in: g-proteobacteria)]
MDQSSVPVTVRILDREYQVACREDEREALIAAAEFVHERMREVRGQRHVIGTDRIAVMTALNIAHELLALRETEHACERIEHQVDGLQERVTAALSADA